MTYTTVTSRPAASVVALRLSAVASAMLVVRGSPFCHRLRVEFPRRVEPREPIEGFPHETDGQSSR